MKTFSIISAILFFAACSQTVVPTDSSSIATESIEGGAWQTGCDYADSMYGISSVIFANGQFTQSATSYDTSSCSTGYFKVEITGTYILGGKLSASSSAEKIDMTLAVLEFTPLDSSVVSTLNSMSFCGYSDWAINVGKDVTGRTCDSSPMPSAGDVSYDIYYISILDGSLNFGSHDASHDGTSDSQRPTILDGGTDYYR